MSLGPSPIIGILGRKRHGKSTAAKRLVDAHGYREVALAAPMRIALTLLDPIVGLDNHGNVVGLSTALDWHNGWEGIKDSPYAAEARSLLQIFGTEVGRNLFGEDFWVDQALQFMQSINGPVVVPDVRFRNEAEALEKAGAVLVRVVRPDYDDEEDAHPSEHDLDDYEPHGVLLNDGDVETLHHAVDDLAAVASEHTRPTLSPNSITEVHQ